MLFEVDLFPLQVTVLLKDVLGQDHIGGLKLMFLVNQIVFFSDASLDVIACCSELIQSIFVFFFQLFCLVLNTFLTVLFFLCHFISF